MTRNPTVLRAGSFRGLYIEGTSYARYSLRYFSLPAPELHEVLLRSGAEDFVSCFFFLPIDLVQPQNQE